jgi:hypothetical protein
MESRMLKRLKSLNPDKVFPDNIGQKWTDEEETLLLEELSKNIDIDLIAQSHNRSLGGINARRKHIAYYKFYCNNISIEEIMVKTKLDSECILATIKTRQNPQDKKQCYVKPFVIKDEIIEIKNDIREIKNSIKELVAMMNAVYEFEDS